jgi:hypothetical protein
MVNGEVLVIMIFSEREIARTLELIVIVNNKHAVNLCKT